MNINIQNGEIYLNDRLSILPGQRVKAALLSFGDTLSLKLENGAFAQYETEKLFIDERPAIVRLTFRNDVIYYLSIYFLSGEIGWSSTTQSVQEELKVANDEWLQRKIEQAPPYIRPWGKVESLYDPRSAISEIVVTYQ